jgi:hypothetical protein
MDAAGIALAKEDNKPIHGHEYDGTRQYQQGGTWGTCRYADQLFVDNHFQLSIGVSIMSDVIFEMAEKMEKSVEAFKNELAKIRTGRASLALLDDIKVHAYGSEMPLNQVSTLTIPESRTDSHSALGSTGAVSYRKGNSQIGRRPDPCSTTVRSSA